MKCWMLRLRGLALAGVLALLLLLRAPALVGAVWRNVGMLVLRDGLSAQADLLPSVYPVHEVLGESPAGARAMQNLRRALALNGNSLSTQWALGRTALAVGDVATAADVLEPLVDNVRRNPLLYCDALTTLSYSRRPEAAIALYESAPPPQHTQVISDAVALAYLDLAMGGRGDRETRRQGDKEAGGQGEVGQWLEQAYALRPGDLYANYCLWKQAREARDLEAAAVYSETLVYFPLEVLHPTAERLLDYVADAVLALLEEGLWDQNRTLNVVSFLVWQHNEAAGIERLLEQLIERYPNDPDWRFYLGELYYRRGDLARAETAYQQVLAAEPEYAQAYLRLGTIAEAQSQAMTPRPQERLEEAARRYKRYHELAPDDLLGLKRLAEVCTALEEEGEVEDPSCREVAERVSRLGFRAEPEVSSVQPEISPAVTLWSWWTEQVTAAKPEYLVGQPLGNGWTLVGYDVDEDRLVLGEPVDLLVYWEGPGSMNAGPEQDGWYWAGGRWVQVLEGAQNLIPDGGFEMGAEGGTPPGFPADLYGAEPSTRRLTTDVRAGQHTTVALLDNTEVYSRTSFASVEVPIHPHGLYLQAGWIRSVDGYGCLGRLWLGDIASEVTPYDYVVTAVVLNDWLHYAGVVRPLPGANRCQIWLLNYTATGRVYFDNVLFVEIGLPGE